jgi:hypothetical protein
MTEVPAWHARHQWDRARTSFSNRSTPGWRASTGLGKEVNNYMLISEWLDYVRQNWRKQEGQTMAEYGVVLAVITIRGHAPGDEHGPRGLADDDPRELAA